MLSKKYADTDFFLALLKDSDWLKEKAKKIYSENREGLYVSPFTVMELMIVCHREGIPLKETLLHTSRIARISFVKWDLFFRAVDYIEQGASIFDAVFMAFIKENELEFDEKCEIISSDNVYKKFGFEVINLKD